MIMYSIGRRTHLYTHARERVHVARRCPRELRAAEIRGQDQLRRKPADAPRAVRARCEELRDILRDGGGETEIREAGVSAVRDQDVRAPQVPVDDVLGV